jgi:hypothetical protein
VLRTLHKTRGGSSVSTTGQLFFRIAEGNDVQLGAIDNTATATPSSIYFGGGFNSGTPQNTSTFNGNETSVVVDTAAGLVFSAGSGNGGGFNGVSVHNLYTGELIETITFGTFDVVQALALDPFTNTLYVGDWGNDTDTTGVAAFTYDPATGLLTPNTTGSSATTITTTIGSTSTTATATGIYLFTETQVPEYTNATRSTSIAPMACSITSTTTAATTAAHSARPTGSTSSTPTGRRSPRPS